MNKLACAFAFGVVSCLLTIAAQGQDETNTAVSDFPDPHCSRPEVKLIKPGYTHVDNIADAGPVGSYNDKVKVYNQEAKDYDFCMHAYIDNANAELKRTQNKANTQIRLIADTANTRLKLIEAKISAAAQDANQVAQDEAIKHK
jgi:hypothetical protein